MLYQADGTPVSAGPSPLLYATSWDGVLGDATKRLAEKLVAEDPRTRQITKDELEHLDFVLWRYKKHMPWHAAAGCGMKRLLTYNPAIKTAGVGWMKGQICLAVNAGYFFSLTLMQQIFVLAHETEHIIRMHITTAKEWPGMQKQLNFVMDALVNSSLVSNYDHFRAKQGEPPPLPEKLITWEHWNATVGNQPKDPNLRGVPWPKPGIEAFIHDFTAEQLLKYLPKGRDKDDDQSGCATDGSGQQDQQQGKGQGQPGDGDQGDGSGEGEDDLMDELYGEAGEFFDDESTPDEMKKAIVRNILEEAEQSCGRGPGYLQSYCDRIMDKKNRNWRMALRGCGWSTKIAISQSWSKVNKRMPWRKPGKYIFTRPPVLLVIDRSGSVGAVETNCFIMEVNGIVSWVDMDVIFVDDGWSPDNPDTYIKGIDKLEPWKWWKDMGGGTYFKDVYEWLINGEGKGKYETVIFLTDGMLADNPRIPGRCARHNVAILTPSYDQRYYDEAKALGFQVVIIDDAQRQQAREIREQMR